MSLNRLDVAILFAQRFLSPSTFIIPYMKMVHTWRETRMKVRFLNKCFIIDKNEKVEKLRAESLPRAREQEKV